MSKGISTTNFKQISEKISKWISNWIFNIFGCARSAPLLDPKGPNNAAEGCRPLHELEKATRRAAILQVTIISVTKVHIYLTFSPLLNFYFLMSTLWGELNGTN